MNQAKYSIEIFDNRTAQGDKTSSLPKTFNYMVMEEKKENKQRLVSPGRIKRKPYTEFEPVLKKKNVQPTQAQKATTS